MTRTAGGNITRTTYQDNAYWDYAYDGRDRLTSATRKDSGGQTLASYTYTYDAGDNIMTKVEAGTTTTFGYDSANELTTSTTGGTSTNYGYDAWGRMTSKAISGSYSATYAYRYGDKLYSVSSNFPNEGSVTYQYGGDGKRRERTANSTTTKYRWDAGWNMINEEDSNGTLSRTYVGHTLAHVDGTNPANGTYRYYFADNLGSSRIVRNADRSSYAAFEHTPYGDLYASSGTTSSIDRRFTGHQWDSTSQLYYAPFRYYSSGFERWISRDPIARAYGNEYSYALASPVALLDFLGLDVEVCVGLPQGGAWGHSSVTVVTPGEPDIYISHWPDWAQNASKKNCGGLPLNLKPIPDRTFIGDCDAEGGPPSVGCTFQGLDEGAIRRWFKEHEGDNFKAISNNCTTFAIDALQAGGLKMGHDRFTPDDPESFSNKICKCKDREREEERK